MGENEIQTIRMIQIHGKLALTFSLRQFVASARSSLRGPEVFEACSSPESHHAHLFDSLGSMQLVELVVRPLHLPLVEIILKPPNLFYYILEVRRFTEKHLPLHVAVISSPVRHLIIGWDQPQLPTNQG
jgi:hypothetical protein